MADLITLTVLVCVFSVGKSYPAYQRAIPNGMNVPNPCGQGGVWLGVGHNSMKGGGPRNVFGTDFEEYGKKWSKDLCLKDSDEDGLTNGLELGDPHCEWVPGSQKTLYKPAGHPGICEPLHDAYCKKINANINCNEVNIVLTNSSITFN